MLTRLLLSAVACSLTVIGVEAQGPARPPASPPPADPFTLTYQFRFETTQLEDLPHAGTAGSLLETAHGFLVADRIDGGGQFTGERPWLGGQGSAGVQTAWRLDGIDVTDPFTGGAPMLVPDVSALASLTVGAASFDSTIAGPGPVIDLRLREPGGTWNGLASLTLAPSAMQADAPAITPMTRMLSRTDASIATGGGFGPASVFLAVRGTSSTRRDREQPDDRRGRAVSVVASAQASPRPGHAARVVIAVSDTAHPMLTRARFADTARQEDGSGVLAHGRWQWRGAGMTWAVTGGLQHLSSVNSVEAGAAGGAMERLRDGPPMHLFNTGDTRRGRTFIDVEAAPDVRRWLGADHHLRVGVSAGRAGADLTHGPQPAFGELVNGRPARVWDVSFRGPESAYRATRLHAFVNDHVAIGRRLAVAAGLRLEVDRASAEAAPVGVRWSTVSPRLTARWRPWLRPDLTVTTGYSWYRHLLPLGVLAHGDPSGATGTMFRWDDGNGDGAFTSSELTPVARVDLGGTAIDPSLRRPTTGEFRIGLDYALGRWRVGVTGVDRRERHLLALVNTGVTSADYDVEVLSDPGVDIAGLQGFNPLPVYNRRPESFGRDAFALVNSPARDGRYQGVEIAVDRLVGDRWYFRFGGTAYRAEGIGAHRGFRADENDQGLPGEVFLTPNATTYARGRTFYDRAYIMKVLAAYTTPWGLRASVIARYQDGQPFTRVIVAEGLNQGLDLIPTYPRGGQRFTFTGTADVRVEWRGGRGTGAFGLFVEAFNLPNMALEVEEDIVTGPAFRTISAVQPPRVVRAGVSVRF